MAGKLIPHKSASKAAYRRMDVSADIMAGMLQQKTDPVYPPVALAARISGTVVLQATITEAGIIDDLSVVSGPDLLQQAALTAVRTWRYQPYMVNNEPVRLHTTINVVFSLGAPNAAPAEPASISPAPAPAAQPAPVAEVEPPAPVIDVAAQSKAYEFAAWGATLKAATPNAYKSFYQRFPNTSRLKTATATLRARYWFKVAQPFGDDGKHRDGVIVTVDGMNFAVNLSLDAAKNQGVIGFDPAAPDANPDSQGRTFKRIYFEATQGGVLVGNQIITPKDNLNATLYLSADGSQLLAWDLSKSSPDAHPSTEPTMTQDSEGNYACGEACP
jgi:TonB family protein